MAIAPIQLFSEWYAVQLGRTKDKIPGACCLSTIGADGFPNARFVSLKEVRDECFVITGTLTSRKGFEIADNNKVALTFWWTETERQVRVQGLATRISSVLADKYFAERDRESQIVSIIGETGCRLEEVDDLTRRFAAAESSFPQESLERPDKWGGYFIQPKRMEFLEFRANRFHDRTLYEKLEGVWEQQRLQP